MLKAYKETTIERDYRDYYTAIVYTRDRVLGGYYYQPIQADTLTGIKELINYYKNI